MRGPPDQSALPLAMVELGGTTPSQEHIALAKLLDEVSILRNQVDVLTASGVTTPVPKKLPEELPGASPERASTERPTSRASSLGSRGKSIAAEGTHSFRGSVSFAEPEVELDDDTDSYFEVVDAQPYRHDKGFPHSLGPFGFYQTQRIKADDLEVCFNAGDGVCHWQLKSVFKLPPGSGEPDEGCMSPLEEINLVDGARRALGIPDHAIFFAWFHPIFPCMTAATYEPDLKFLKNGGFVYFDVNRIPLHICAVELDFSTGQLLFGRRQALSEKWSDHLWEQGRFHPVPQEQLRAKGATHYTWITCDEEFDGEKLCPKGGFAYRFSSRSGDSPTSCHSQISKNFEEKTPHLNLPCSPPKVPPLTLSNSPNMHTSGRFTPRASRTAANPR